MTTPTELRNQAQDLLDESATLAATAASTKSQADALYAQIEALEGDQWRDRPNSLVLKNRAGWLRTKAERKLAEADALEAAQ